MRTCKDKVCVCVCECVCVCVQSVGQCCEVPRRQQLAWLSSLCAGAGHCSMSGRLHASQACRPPAPCGLHGSSRQAWVLDSGHHGQALLHPTSTPSAPAGARTMLLLCKASAQPHLLHAHAQYNPYPDPDHDLTCSAHTHNTLTLTPALAPPAPRAHAQYAGPDPDPNHNPTCSVHTHTDPDPDPNHNPTCSTRTRNTLALTPTPP